MATRLSRPLLRRVPATCPLTAPVTTSAAQLSSRTFASANERFDESLPRDFRRWLKAEVALLVCLAAAGAVGVHLYQVQRPNDATGSKKVICNDFVCELICAFYVTLLCVQNRSNAPVNQVERLVEAAKQSAQEEDREQALKHCLHAYDVVKRTNPKDRHLFELAFAIAAQYEDLERGAPATKYYLDALEHTSHEAKVAKRERNRVITLDRIAQSYMNRGHGETAERYFRQAISAYDQSRGRRAISKVSTSDRADLAALDREIAAVLFNYSQLMMADKRLDEAGNVLQRALRLARSSLLSEEHADLIKGAIATVQSAKAMETTRVEPDE